MTHPNSDPDSQNNRSNHPLYGTPQQSTNSDEKRQPERRPINVIKVKQATVTWTLIAINAVIFLLQLSSEMTNIQLIVDFSADPAPILRDLELYRLFTAMFLHGSIVHVGFNMYALYIIGMNVERIFGHTRFVIIYFLGGLAGSIISVALGNYDIPSIGASGAVFAVWAAEAVHVYVHRQMYGGASRRILQNTLFFLAMNLFLDFTIPQIDNWGHIGGFVGGLILAYFIGPKYQIRGVPLPTGEARISVHDTNPIQSHVQTVAIYTASLLFIFTLSVMFVGI